MKTEECPLDLAQVRSSLTLARTGVMAVGQKPPCSKREGCGQRERGTSGRFSFVLRGGGLGVFKF